MYIKYELKKMVKISLCYTYMEDQSTFREFCGRHHHWSTATEYLYHRWLPIC